MHKMHISKGVTVKTNDIIMRCIKRCIVGKPAVHHLAHEKQDL